MNRHQENCLLMQKVADSSLCSKERKKLSFFSLCEAMSENSHILLLIMVVPLKCLYLSISKSIKYE